MCDSTESQLAAIHIEYHWVAALLGRAYEHKIARIQQDALASTNKRIRNRYGKGLVRTKAI
jgi:hypothetical protein